MCEWKFERRVSYEEVSVFSKNFKKARFSRFRIYVVVQALGFMSASVLLPYITSNLRIANRVGEDSCCRGGIVHIRGGCSRALLVRPIVPRRFGGFVQVLQTVQVAVLGRNLHASRYIYQIYAQQDIRVYEDDHFSRPRGSIPIPRRFRFFA